MQPPLFRDNGQQMLLVDSVPVDNGDDSYLHIVQINTTVSYAVVVVVVVIVVVVIDACSNTFDPW